jgi:hypothetical protein
MLLLKRDIVLPSRGDLFAIPLCDGTVAVAQLANLWSDGKAASPTYAVYDHRFDSADGAKAALATMNLRVPKFIVTTNGAEIRGRIWTVIGHGSVEYQDTNVEAQMSEWGWFRGREIGYLPMFLEVYWGLRPPYATYATDLKQLPL